MATTVVGGACGLGEAAVSPAAPDDPSASPTISIEFSQSSGADGQAATATTLDATEGATGAAPPGDPVGAEYVVVAHAVGPSIAAHERPDAQSAVVAELANPTEVGGPLAFQAVSADAATADEWLEVYLPIRPNGTTGWVRRQDVTLSSNPYRIEIDTSDHRLVVYRSGAPWIETPVAIGTGDTPTPIGRFYIIELLQPPDPGGVYGPYAFGLSGFSETLSEFAGGAGVIGIHGTNDPSALGTDVSFGCVRMANDVISELAGVLPLGTPVVISA